MALNTLEDLYHDQLQDQWSANRQALNILTSLGEAAKDENLSKALIAGSNGIAEGIRVLEEICNKHGIDPNGEHCKGMEGLVTEAKAHALEEDFSDADVRDATIITQYQRMVHYGVAGYGCLVAFANRLGHDEDGAKLRECLENTRDGDKTMTAIATGGVNAAAA